MPTPPTICLLGGYGDVGFRLARMLHERTPNQIILAGRDESKANAEARRIGPRCSGLKLDVRKPDAIDRLSGYDVCVNLTEATPPALATQLIERGTAFIDTSATPAYVSALREEIANLIKPRAAAILETGLAPGFTNLLAEGIKRDCPEVRGIDILIRMGMGEHHGMAATEWTLKSLGEPYEVKFSGEWKFVWPGSFTRHFAVDGRDILAFGLGFSDQSSIARDLDLDGVRTFLAVDPGWVTRLMSLLSRPITAKLISQNAKGVARLLHRLPLIGRAGTQLVMEGKDAGGRVLLTRRLSGGPQAELTAWVILAAILALKDSPRFGVLRLAELLNSSVLRTET